MYKSMVGLEKECEFMYGNEIIACILDFDWGDEFEFEYVPGYVPCYIMGGTLVNGDLAGEFIPFGGDSAKIQATLTRDIDGLLMLQGTVDTTDIYIQNEDNPNEVDKVVYSFSFTVKETNK